VTALTEPPLDSQIKERPYTLILAEDAAALYNNNNSSSSTERSNETKNLDASLSWNGTFQSKLPLEFGISTGRWSLSPENTTLDLTMQEIKADLSQEPAVVFVARGPWVSWVALLYLESSPLAGLVMVDPLPLDNQDGIKQFQLHYEQHEGLINSQEYQLFQDFVQGGRPKRTLLLEPGAVPMMVLNTLQTDAFRHAADDVARRHSDKDSPSGVVPVHCLSAQNNEYANLSLDLIVNWMDERGF